MVVVIYTKAADPYSIRAKALLRAKHVVFEERELPEHEKELRSLCKTTVTPQILIHGVHIGSFAELGSLELSGKLDHMLVQNEKTTTEFRPDQPRS